MSRATLIKMFDEYFKMQNVIAHRTRLNSVAHKENQNIKGFSKNNHLELTQRILSLKFMSKIK